MAVITGKGGVNGIWWVEARNAAREPTMHSAATKNLNLPQRIIWLEMLTVRGEKLNLAEIIFIAT